MATAHYIPPEEMIKVECSHCRSGVGRPYQEIFLANCFVCTDCGGTMALEYPPLEHALKKAADDYERIRKSLGWL